MIRTPLASFNPATITSQGRHHHEVRAHLFRRRALTEIAGCFAFWAWLRLDRAIWWVVPGVALLILFAYLLTLIDSAAAGRAYAAYGGIYIAVSLGWLWFAEGVRPERFDVIGALICLAGAAVILAASR